MFKDKQTPGCDYGPNNEDEDGDELIRFEINSSTGYRLEIRLLESIKASRTKSTVLKCKQWSPLHGDKSWTRAVGAGYVDYLLRNLAEARIPAIPEYVAGLDGTDYELMLNQGFNITTYRWWGNAPKGYEPIAAFTNELLKLARCNERVSIDMADTQN